MSNDTTDKLARIKRHARSISFQWDVINNVWTYNAKFISVPDDIGQGGTFSNAVKVMYDNLKRRLAVLHAVRS